MTPSAAEALAVKISQTWTRTAPVDVWVEDLLDLDEGAAGTAFVKLRRESLHPPSIAQFRAVTFALRTHDASDDGPVCDTCDNTGWQEAPDRIHDLGTPRQRATSQTRPCHCEHGQQRANSRTWTQRKTA